MRTFKVMPAGAGHEHSHLWQLIAVEEDGSEITLETYGSASEANAAKLVLERDEVQDSA
jgi:hypothetical protein